MISEVDDDEFVLTTGDGSDLRFHMAAGALAHLNLQTCDAARALAHLNLQTCDAAAVSYHQDGGMLIADSVNDTGVSISSTTIRT